MQESIQVGQNTIPKIGETHSHELSSQQKYIWHFTLKNDVVGLGLRASFSAILAASEIVPAYSPPT
jgi:hypothetical protein